MITHSAPMRAGGFANNRGAAAAAPLLNITDCALLIKQYRLRSVGPARPFLSAVFSGFGRKLIGDFLFLLAVQLHAVAGHEIAHRVGGDFKGLVEKRVEVGLPERVFVTAAGNFFKALQPFLFS